MSSSNPWVPAPAEPADDSAAATTPPQPLVEQVNAVQPQPGAVSHPSGALPLAPQNPVADWWWLGCHGGAGVTCLQQALGAGADAQRHWPLPSAYAPATRHQVVLVTRTHAAGLTAAQTALQQWAAGSVPGAQVAGLVLVADSPERLPRPLRDLRALVTGGAPRVWSVPWIAQWRLGTAPSVDHARRLGRLGGELAQMTRSARV